jgi:hypothetical protein
LQINNSQQSVELSKPLHKVYYTLPYRKPTHKDQRIIYVLGWVSLRRLKLTNAEVINEAKDIVPLQANISYNFFPCTQITILTNLVKTWK